jgi:hypothetical protein
MGPRNTEAAQPLPHYRSEIRRQKAVWNSYMHTHTDRHPTCRLHVQKYLLCFFFFLSTTTTTRTTRNTSLLGPEPQQSTLFWAGVYRQSNKFNSKFYTLHIARKSIHIHIHLTYLHAYIYMRMRCVSSNATAANLGNACRNRAVVYLAMKANKRSFVSVSFT